MQRLIRYLQGQIPTNLKEGAIVVEFSGRRIDCEGKCLYLTNGIILSQEHIIYKEGYNFKMLRSNVIIFRNITVILLGNGNMCS
jgi:hypothetical protein